MDRVTNPYQPGAGSDPPELTGRDGILEDARVAFARIRRGRMEQGILLTGLRGVGKTVLLERMRQMAEADGYIADLREAPEGGHLATILVPTLRSALLKLSVRAKVKDAAERAMRVLKSFSLIVRIEGIDFGLKFDPEPGTADSGFLERDLPDLLCAVGEAARDADSAVALLLDEIQYLSKSDLSALVIAANRVSQRKLPVAIMGAGLPLLVSLSGEAKTYAERLFVYPRIGALSDEDARKALENPAAKLDVRYDEAALQAILRSTEGYPYFIQEWGYAAWNAAPSSPIGIEDVQNAEGAAVRKLDESFFRMRLEKVTEAEERYLRGMAELGVGPYKSSSIAKLFGKTAGQFGPTRDALIKKAVIYSPKRGYLDFTVPLFGSFMLRAIPKLRAK